MKLRKPVFFFVAALFVCAATSTLALPSLMENLGRGVVAIRTTATDVFVSWRVLGTDPPDTSFNLYRSTGGGPATLMAGSPFTGATNFVDTTADLAQTNAYTVRPIIYGIEQAPSAAFTLPVAVAQAYLRVPLMVPPAGLTPAVPADPVDPVGLPAIPPQPYTYSPNDASVGDLDGDGEYEIIVKWDPSNAQDNANTGITGSVYLDAYKLDGTRLWRIDLGRNIRAGAHYTQFQVYDLDGDGKAEVACKTADGTVDGVGTVIGDALADWRDLTYQANPASHRVGYVLHGPEFLTIFNGQTGAALATTNFVPDRGTVTDWGDNYGNRVDRFLAGIAYVDGQRPSLIMARGYYTRAVVTAWNWRAGALTQVWSFDTGHTGGPYAGYRGMGNHQLSVGDVDGDGKDEIMYGACAIDDDGTGLFTTGWAHGDALHMSDMDPDRPGLEVWENHESPTQYGPNAGEFRDAHTGALIWGVQAGGDIGRGLALDVDPRYRGYEMWASGATGGMYTAQQSSPNAVLGPRGVQIAANKPSINFGVWWDGDLLRELLDGNTISKWDWLAGTATTVLTAAGASSNNGTKATPTLSADILGDWREEVIWRENANDALRIYTTTVPTSTRLYTLMHDRQYRDAIAWQNTAYNQPPHPSFFLGDGMSPAPTPNIVTSLSTLLGPPAPAFTTISGDTGVSSSDFVTSDATLVIGGTAQPNTTVNVIRFGVGPIGTAPADGGGVWSLDYTGTTLPEGVSTFTATATDSLLNTGAPAPPFSVRVDTIAPAAPVIVSVSSEGGLVFNGTAEAGSSATVTLIGTGTIGSATTNAQGLWTLSYGAALPPGPYSFTATATDAAGNTSGDSATVNINTTVTTAGIAAISDDTGPSASDGITSDNTLALSGTAGAGDTVTLTRADTGTLGSTTADGGGAWTFDYTGTTLADGGYSFRATGSNGAGTGASSAAFAVVVDTLPPSVLSVNRLSPTAASSSVDTIIFHVTFSESVSGVDAADFTPVFTGGLAGSITAVSSGSGAGIDVTIGPMTGEGTVRLDVNAAGTAILDAAGHALSAGFTTGQVYSRVLTGTGTYTRLLTGGLWSANPNWQEGIVGGGTNNTANFTGMDLVEDNLVHLDTPRSVGNLVFADVDISTPGNWIVDNNSDPLNVLTLSVSAGSPSVVVNALGAGATATISAQVAGTTGLTKSGSGILALGSVNSLIGTFNVTNGAVRLNAGSSLNLGGGAINVTTTAGVLLHVNGGTLTTSGLATFGNGTTTSGLFTLTGGSATFTGGVRTASESGSTFRINGGTFTTTDVNIGRNSAGTPDFNSGFIIMNGVANVGTVRLGTANSNGAMSVEGGALNVTGAISIGNLPANSNRGGAMRVIGGTFTSSDTASGITMSLQNNNTSSATFTAGTSTVEKFTLGGSAGLATGSTTITLNGGTLYLGSGGIVRNPTAPAYLTNLNFSSGTLGAKANWSTSVPIAYPAAGNVTLKTADAADVARDVTLSGVLSGAGGFTKTGAGSLTLSAANTFAGPVVVSAGTLSVTGTQAAASALSVNGGTLTGTGTIGGAVTLNSGGTIAPGVAPATNLTAGSLAWNGGGGLAYTLGSGNQLVLTGALTKGSSTGFNVAFSTTGPLTVGTVYTLATFASTTFGPMDFSYSGLTGYLGLFIVNPTSLQFVVTGAGATAEFTHWAYQTLPPGQRGAADDPDGDASTNLLEFVLGTDPALADADGIRTTTVDVSGKPYPAVVYLRRQNRGGVTVDVQASAAPQFGTPYGTVEVSAVPQGNGFEEVTTRSTLPLEQHPRLISRLARPPQFFRVTATLPGE